MVNKEVKKQVSHAMIKLGRSLTWMENENDAQ